MTSDQFISVRETSQILGISEKKVMDLIDGGKLQAYRIADQFLRLKKTEVLNIRNSGQIVNENVHYEYSKSQRFMDFIYFNDFYILAALVIFGLLYVILYMA